MNHTRKCNGKAEEERDKKVEKRFREEMTEFIGDENGNKDVLLSPLDNRDTQIRRHEHGETPKTLPKSIHKRTRNIR